MKSLAVLAGLGALAIPAVSHADRNNPFYIRAGVLHLEPLESSREMELADIDGPASLSIKNGPIEGSGSTVSSATVFGAIIGYTLPWKNGAFAVETILGLPFKVKFRATGSLAEMSIAPTALGLPTGVPAIGSEMGEATAIPPVVTLIYRLMPGRVQPYVGAGASVMFAVDPKVTNPLLTEVSQPEMSIAPAPGLVLQSGIDVKLAKRVYARLDVKFIALMLARAEVHHIEVKTPDLPLFDTVEVGTAKMSVWVNPLIVQLGIGTDF
jgi:outer membrane protein W